MKYYFSTLFFLLGSILLAQDFYDLNTIQSIEINFTQSNWDQILDAAYAGSGDYTMAETVVLNGEIFDSVGVKYKGNSTYNPGQAKNPFHIELDTYKDQNYDGYKDIKLSNVAKDPSFLREVLSYQILRQYMDAPLSNYANVYVNGELIGLYSNSEAITKTFVNSRFYSKTNTFIKCNPPAGAGPQSNDYPNLVYLGQDSLEYYDAYEMKSDGGWQELIDLCDTLVNETAALDQILDIDRALWMLAFNNVLVNLDSYNGQFAQNYYLYRTEYGQFVPVVWDLNESFGRFSNTGSGNLNSTTAKQQMNHLLHENDADFPLIQQLLNIPTYKRRYIAHCKTIVLENFDNNSFFDTGIALQNLIADDVLADDNKFFSYANFENNLTSDINGGPGPGGGSTPGISNLMNGRSNYLLGLTDFTQASPTISNIAPSTPSPIVGETISISAEITEENAVFLNYRSERGAPFVSTPMFDDGMHDDGAANDGIYAASLTIDNAYVQYYLYAENDNAGLFSPQRAAHEYYTLTATTSNPTVEDLVINEFLASNDITVADQDDEFDDWVELYNNSSEGISLDGYFLSDDPDDLMKWAFPSGTAIGGNDYLIIWTDDDEEQEGLHTNFKLSAAAESVILVAPDGAIVDEVSYVDQVTDISFGRFPNGTGDFQSMSPTFNAENSGTTSTFDPLAEEMAINVIPNPAKGSFYLELPEDITDAQRISIFDLNGKTVHQATINSSTTIDASNWVAGLYFIRLGNSFTKVVIK